MLTTMYKRERKNVLYIYGHLTSLEVYELKTEGWCIEWRDKPKHLKSPQVKKNGIPVERSIYDGTTHAKRLHSFG